MKRTHLHQSSMINHLASEDEESQNAYKINELRWVARLVYQSILFSIAIVPKASDVVLQSGFVPA